MQQHHYQAVPQNTACTMLPSEACKNIEREENRKVSTSQIRSGSDHPWSSNQRSTTSPRTSTVVDHHRTSVRNAEGHSDASIMYAWGATGEQEWTPTITTGVDWKSLVVPACLPITTDFFPDQRSLHNDYVVTSYSLLPEDQGAELLTRVCYRGGEDLRNHIPFSVQQVLEELTCQRLQQGFQLIISPDLRNGLNLGNSSYTLSIGRIFHKLSIDGGTNKLSTDGGTNKLSIDGGTKIDVKQYKPRHPYPTIKIQYSYRFRAPDNQTYGVSWVDFVSEKLENYNWNYLDNYICLRGEEEYELRDELKFWRFRILLLPNICQSITQRITAMNAEGQPELRCLGAYRESTHQDRMKLFEGFLKFIEIISKIKRTPPQRLPMVKPSTRSGIVGLRQGPTSPNPDSRMRNPSGTVFKTAPRPPDAIDGGIVSSMALESRGTNSGNSQTKIEPLKKIQVPSLKEVKMKMMNESSINFMMDQKGLAPFSFIAAEAIFWAIETFKEIENESMAVKLFQQMVQEELITHSSGDIKFPFVCGFYLYFIVDPKTKSKIPAEVDLEMFQKDWIELEMCLKEVSSESDAPPSNPWKHKFHKS